MKVHELGHVVFYVRDIERSRHFYKDILGWKEIGYVPSGMVAFSSGRTPGAPGTYRGGRGPGPRARAPAAEPLAETALRARRRQSSPWLS